MQARKKNTAMMIPKAMQALQLLSKMREEIGVPSRAIQASAEPTCAVC
jgi:hypothetical protein